MTTRTRARRLVLRAMLLLCLLAVAYVASVAGRIWWTARQDARPESDAIVVLGASQFDGQPSPVFEARLEHAQALYESGLAPLIVTVGGKQPDDRVTEAAAGRSFLIEAGVPEDAVVAVESGKDTVSSLSAVHEAAAEGGWGSIILVTDPWHEFRALRIARDLGFETAGSPARAGPAVRTQGDAGSLHRSGDGCVYLVSALRRWRQRGLCPRGSLIPSAAALVSEEPRAIAKAQGE